MTVTHIKPTLSSYNNNKENISPSKKTSENKFTADFLEACRSELTEIKTKIENIERKMKGFNNSIAFYQTKLSKTKITIGISINFKSRKITINPTQSRSIELIKNLKNEVLKLNNEKLNLESEKSNLLAFTADSEKVRTWIG